MLSPTRGAQWKPLHTSGRTPFSRAVHGVDSADRIKLSRIDARIVEIERGSPAERRRLGEMLKALLAARAEIVRWDRREG